MLTFVVAGALLSFSSAIVGFAQQNSSIKENTMLRAHLSSHGLLHRTGFDIAFLSLIVAVEG